MLTSQHERSRRWCREHETEFVIRRNAVQEDGLTPVDVMDIVCDRKDGHSYWNIGETYNVSMTLVKYALYVGHNAHLFPDLYTLPRR